MTPQTHVEILNPNMIALGGEAFGRSLGHAGGALMNEINVQIKGTPENFLPLFLPYEDTR